MSSKAPHACIARCPFPLANISTVDNFKLLTCHLRCGVEEMHGGARVFPRAEALDEDKCKAWVRIKWSKSLESSEF